MFAMATERTASIKPKPASGVVEITPVGIVGFAANEPRYDAGCTGSCVYDASDKLLPGQYFDEETNLHYNYFRYYDPNLGRYITSDPTGLGDGPNTYAYVHGNPLTYFDPNGLWSVSINGYAGLGGGIAIGQNNQTGQWFITGSLGIGVGGGFTIDPIDNGPTAIPLSTSAYNNSCSSIQPGATGSSIGSFIGIGAGIGPYGGTYGAQGGIHFNGSNGSYSQGPGWQSQFNAAPGGSGGLSIGGAFGIQVSGWW